LIVEGYGYIVGACTLIVKIFPSEKTNTFWGNVVKVLDFFSTVFTDSDKRKLKE
jgi:hypothetical protein